MPHSSGGGSHSGESHSSSHNSSNSNHSSSGSRNAYRVSNTYYNGAARYVRYYNNKPEYIYANYDIINEKRKPRYALILFYIPFILAIISMFATTIYIPKHLNYNTNEYAIIKDEIDVFSDIEEKELKNSIYNFYNQTHIPIEIITVNNSEWKTYHSSLEQYAYDLYVNDFEDENHWLLVYSQPEDVEDTKFVAWYWEGMQGDNTDIVLTKISQVCLMKMCKNN